MMKHCVACGCLLEDDYEEDVCPCCLDDGYEDSPIDDLFDLEDDLDD